MISSRKKRTDDEQDAPARRTSASDDKTRQYEDGQDRRPTQAEDETPAIDDRLTLSQAVNDDPLSIVRVEDIPDKIAGDDFERIPFPPLLSSPSPQSQATNDESVDDVTGLDYDPSAMLPPTQREIYESRRRRVDDIQNRPIERQSRLKSALLSGLMGISQAFQQNPSRSSAEFFANLAQGAGIGVVGAVKPTLANRMKRDMELNRARRDLAEAEQDYQNDQAFRGKEASIEMQNLRPELERGKVAQRSLELQNRIYRDERNFQLKLDAERAKAEREGNRHKIEVDENTGRMIRVYNDGRVEPIMFEGKPLLKPSKQMYDYTDPATGENRRVTGAQALSASATIVAGQDSASRFNASVENRYNEDLRDYNNKLTALKARSEGAVNMRLQTEAQLRETEARIKSQGYPATPEQVRNLESQRKRIIELDAEARQAAREYSELRPPSRPQTVTPTSVSNVQKYAGKEYRLNQIRQYFPGHTDDQIRAKVASGGGKVID